MPANPVDSISQWKHLTGLDLADPEFGTPGRVDLLLGPDFTEKYFVTTGGGAHEAHLLHRRRALDGSWPDRFNHGVPDQQRTPAACLQRMTP